MCPLLTVLWSLFYVAVQLSCEVFPLAIPNELISLSSKVDYAFEGDIHPKLREVVHLIESCTALRFVRELDQLVSKLPTRATVDESKGVTLALDIVDKARMFGLLGVWKVSRLIETSLHSWADYNPLGFNTLGAIVTGRAALEEASRAFVITEELDSLLRSPDQTATRNRLDELLSLAEDTGTGLGHKATVKRAIADLGLGLTEQVGADLYSFLSTVSHPEGLSRDVFRARGFHNAFLLSCSPSKFHHGSVFVGWQATLGLAALATLESWSRIEGTLIELIAGQEL